MAKCIYCGKDFDLDDARYNYDSGFSGLSYDDGYGETNPVCFECAYDETSAALGTGEELLELMDGHDWESD